MKCALLLLFLLSAAAVAQDIAPLAFPPTAFPQAGMNLTKVVVLDAVVQEAPPSITLRIHNPGVYEIYRRPVGSGGWGSPVATTAAGQATWTDSSVAVGTVYEYRVSTPGSISGDWKSGYLAAGIRVDRTGSRGRILVVVDATQSGPLAMEIARLSRDLAAEGWTPQLLEVARGVGWNDGAGGETVRAAIAAAHAGAPSGDKPAALYLLGHVPVVQSGGGEDTPDGHTTGGFKVADQFFGDVDGAWTDTDTVTAWSNDTNSAATSLSHVPGDKIFDQDFLPSDVEMGVGRVDLSDLPVYGPVAETTLLQRYLDKAHAFRRGTWGQIRQSVLKDGNEIADWFGYRAFVSTVGMSDFRYRTSDPTSGVVPYTNSFGPFLWWNEASGGGTSTGSTTIGFGSANFATSGTEALFWTGWQSHYWRWSGSNNLMRAGIAASGKSLGFFSQGRCGWFFHRLGLGEPLAVALRDSANSSRTAGPYFFQRSESGGLFYNDSSRKALMNYMGDPSLTLFPVAPVGSVNAVRSGGNVSLTWSSSPDATIGYHIYRSASLQGPFLPLTSSPVTTLAYDDLGAPAGNLVYLVRAVKLETTGSGTFLNPSAGTPAIVPDAVTAVLQSNPGNGDLQMTAGRGASAASASVTISSASPASAGTLSVTTGTDWLQASVSGSTVTLSVVPAAADPLYPGTYRGSVRVTAANGFAPLDVPVELTVLGEVHTPVLHDTYSNGTSPDTNYGTSGVLSVTGTARYGYIMLDMTPHAGRTPVSAVLQIRSASSSGSTSKVRVRALGNSTWTETTLTHNNRPSDAQLGSTLADQLPTPPSTWVSIDITQLLQDELATGDGIIALHLASASGSINFETDESSNRPRVFALFTALPVISSQPQSQTIPEGTSATLGVTASNAESYQWFRGESGNTSEPVSGATGSSFTTAPLAAGTHSFWVRATNTNGSVNSTTATITAALIPTTPKDIYFNFGAATLPATWNGLPTATSSVTSAVDSTGNATGIGITLSGWSSAATTGVDSSAVFPVAGVQRSFLHSAAAPGASSTVTISGLDSRKRYDLLIFASRGSITGPRTVGFSAGTASGSLDVANNTASTVSFTNLSPTGGQILLTATETNDANFAYIGVIRLTERHTFPTWLEARGVQPSDSGDLSDPDNDLLANLLEYAFGLHPRNPDTNGATALEIIENDLALTYSHDPRKTDISYTVLQSDDLTAWQPATGVEEVVAETDGTETITMRVSTGPTGRRFLKLEVRRN